MQLGTRLVPIEIKLNSSPRKRDLRGLISCMQDLELSQGYVVYPGEASYRLSDGITVFLLDAPNRPKFPIDVLRRFVHNGGAVVARGSPSAPP